MPKSCILLVAQLLFVVLCSVCIKKAAAWAPTSSSFVHHHHHHHHHNKNDRIEPKIMTPRRQPQQQHQQRKGRTHHVLLYETMENSDATTTAAESSSSSQLLGGGGGEIHISNGLEDEVEGVVVHAHEEEISPDIISDMMMMETKAATTTTVGASFGDVVPRRSGGGAAASSSVASSSSSSFLDATEKKKKNDDDDETAIQLAEMKRRNVTVAVLSVALAISNYIWQFMHPISPVQLLVDMQSQSAPVTVIGANHKPTVVDFWAPWCDNCKLIAPTLLQVEEEYADRVNFVMIDGDKRASWPYIEAFGVDAIPHLALVSADGDVETALIGPIPKHVLEADLDVMLANAAASTAKNTNINGASSSSSPETTTATTASSSLPSKRPLPHVMLDVFAGQPETARRVHFDSSN